MHDHLIDESASPAFVIRRPNASSRLFVVLDRSGLVLARVRSGDDAITVVLRHLEALHRPAPDTIRLRMRSLIGKGGHIVLAAPPLFVDPPVTERRLERAGFRIVDRLVVDIGADGEIGNHPATDLSRDRREVVGHAVEPGGRRASAILLSKPHGGPVTLAMRVQQLIQTTAGGPSYAAADVAEQLADVQTAFVDPNRRSSVYEALESLR